MKKIYAGFIIAMVTIATSFSTKAQVCCPPFNLSASAIGGGNIMFCWSYTTGSANCFNPAKFKIKVYQCGTTITAFMGSFNPTGSPQCQTVGGFTPGVSYCWKLRTKCSTSAGMVYSMWVSGPGVIATEPRELNATENIETKVFPNPASNEISIEGMSFKNENVQFSIYNIMGQRVQSESQNMNAGDWMKDMDVSSLPVGNYVIKITSASGAGSITFVKE